VKSIAFLLLLAAAGGAVSGPVPDWKVTAEPAKKLIASFETPMKIHVTDRKGTPVTGAAVELVVTMIGMDHGEHKSRTTMVAPGIYEGTINFFMIGPWNLEVRVKKARQSMAKTIQFDVKE
jgi:hypothetical protein